MNNTFILLILVIVIHVLRIKQRGALSSMNDFIAYSLGLAVVLNSINLFMDLQSSHNRKGITGLARLNKGAQNRKEAGPFCEARYREDGQ